MIYTKSYYVYLLTNWSNKAIYVGVTNDLSRRFYEHKNKLVPSFTKKYNLNKLVYFEETQDINAVIAREKKLRNGVERKRISLLIK